MTIEVISSGGGDKGFFDPSERSATTTSAGKVALAKNVSTALKIIDFSKDSNTKILEILKDCGALSKGTGGAVATVGDLCLKLQAAAIYDLQDLFFGAGVVIRAIVDAEGHRWSAAQKKEAAAFIDTPLRLLADKDQDLGPFWDNDVHSCWTATTVKTLATIKARLLSSNCKEGPSSHVRRRHRYLEPDIDKEQCPFFQVTLAFSSVESIFNQKWHGKVGVESICASINERLSDLTPEIRKGITGVLCGAFSSIRNSLAHGNGRYTKEQLLLTTKLLNDISYFLQPAKVRNADTAPSMPSAAYVRASDVDYVAAFDALGVNNPQRGQLGAVARHVASIEESLERGDPRVLPQHRYNLIRLATTANDLLEAFLNPVGVTYGLADTRPSTTNGRHFKAFQQLELAVGAGLKAERLKDMAPRSPRDRIDFLLSSKATQKKLSLSEGQAGAISQVLRSMFMLFRNLPTHNHYFQTEQVGSLLDTFVSRLTAKTFLQIATRQKVAPPDFGDQEILSAHPVVLQGCFSSCSSGNWAKASKDASHLLKKICHLSQRTYTLDKEPIAQQMRRMESAKLLFDGFTLFEDEKVFPSAETKEGAYERMALASAILALYFPEQPALLCEETLRGEYHKFKVDIGALLPPEGQGAAVEAQRRYQGNGTYRQQKLAKKRDAYET